MRGENEEDSDMDLLIEFKGEKSLFDLSALKIKIEEMLKMEVDILTYNSLNPLIKRNILNEQEVFLDERP